MSAMLLGCKKEKPVSAEVLSPVEAEASIGTWKATSPATVVTVFPMRTWSPLAAGFSTESDDDNESTVGKWSLKICHLRT